MKSKIRITLLVVFFSVFLFSAVMLIREGMEYKTNKNVYDDAREVAGLPNMSELDDLINNLEGLGNEWWEETGVSMPEDPGSVETDPSGEVKPGGSSATAPRPGTTKRDPYAEFISKADISALKAQNKDVVGYIYVKGISSSCYPIVKADDNDYYLYRTWLRKDNKAGSIFMECLCSPDFSDFNTILYGHRMINGSMFGFLKNYKSKSYWNSHPTVYIMTEEGLMIFDIFAAYEVSVKGVTYQISCPNDESKQEFIDFALKSSVINTGIKPTVKDKILTLSTCSGKTYETRWVVLAVERT